MRETPCCEGVFSLRPLGLVSIFGVRKVPKCLQSVRLVADNLGEHPCSAPRRVAKNSITCSISELTTRHTTFAERLDADLAEELLLLGLKLVFGEQALAAKLAEPA
jgi:hypothetical protein